MIGGLQTQEALKLIHGMPVSSGSAMVFNGVANTFYTTRFQRKEDCLSHDSWPDPVDLPYSATSDTAAALLAAAGGRIPGDGPLTIALERDLVVSIDCHACQVSRRVMKPRQLVSIGELKCRECGALARPTLVHAVEQDTPLAEEKLIELGIPRYDMVRIASECEEGVFLLAGDRDAAPCVATSAESAPSGELEG
jgi:adenylyltransferase/sulfurtransferase